MTPKQKPSAYLKNWRRTTVKGMASTKKGVADRKAERELARVGQSFESAAVQNVLTMWGSK